MTLHVHAPHPHQALRAAQGPVTVDAQLRRETAVQRFNARLAVRITRIVGSMWCAYAFGLFDLISLPAAIHSGTAAIISWIAQTFLQLVLLSIIMVGQDVQAKASDARSEQEFGDVEAILHGQGEQALHLAVQDEHILAILDRLDLRTTGGITDVLAEVQAVRSLVAARLPARPRP